MSRGWCKKAVCFLWSAVLCLCFTGCEDPELDEALGRDYQGDFFSAPESAKTRLDLMEKELEMNRADLDHMLNWTLLLQQENAMLEEQNAELQTLVDEAQPWFALSAIEQEKKEQELQRQKEEEKEANRKKEEEKEKERFQTGITYEQLMRTPDEYYANRVTFSGRVMQVFDQGETIILLQVDGDPSKVLYGHYYSSKEKIRAMVGDEVTVSGMFEELYTYQSTGNGMMTVPSISILILEYHEES